jgi:hypothetical protein
MDLENISTYFDKNKYDVNQKIDNEIKDFNKEECSSYTIKNNYKGFKYEGDNNQCFLYKTKDFNVKMNEDDINKFKNWKINTFLKNRGTIDIANIEDRNKYSSYFDKINNNYYISDDLINKYTVLNEDECLLKCIDENDNCNSLIYLEQPKACTFYNNKIMKTNKDINDYDIYTIKNNNIKNIDKLSYKDIKQDINQHINQHINQNINQEINQEINQDINQHINQDNIHNPFYSNEFNKDIYMKKSFDNYSDCINIDNIRNKKDEIKLFNENCRKKYGNEYIYDNNILDITNMVKCDNDLIKIKCKHQFTYNNLVEKFDNIKNNNLSYNKIIILLLFFILFLVIIYKIIYMNLK